MSSMAAPIASQNGKVRPASPDQEPGLPPALDSCELSSSSGALPAALQQALARPAQASKSPPPALSKIPDSSEMGHFSPLQQMRDLLRQVARDPSKVLERVMAVFANQVSAALLPDEEARLQRLKNLNAPLCLKKRHDLNTYFSADEIAALSQIPVTLADLLQAFKPDRVDLRGSAAHYVIDAKTRFNDIDFSLVIGQPWTRASAGVHQRFAEFVLSKAQVRPKCKIGHRQAQALFEAYLHNPRLITTEQGELFKLRLNMSPAARLAGTFAIDITFKTPQWRSAAFDKLDSAYAILNVLGKKPRHSGPPVELIRWLAQHRIRYFADTMVNGLERVVRTRSKGPVTLLQPELVRHYYTLASHEERCEAMTYVLIADLHLQRRALALYDGSDRERLVQPLRSGLLMQLSTDDDAPLRNEQCIDDYLHAKAAASSDRLDSAYWGAQQTLTRHISTMCDILARHCLEQLSFEEQINLLNGAFATVSSQDTVSIWEQLSGAEENAIVLAQRALLMPALYHFAFSSESSDSENTGAADKAMAIIAESTDQPSHLADRLIHQLRSNMTPAITHRSDAVLPDLITRCDIANRCRIASAWFALVPSNPTAEHIYYHPDILLRRASEKATLEEIDEAAELFVEAGKRSPSETYNQIIVTHIRQHFIALGVCSHPLHFEILQRLENLRPAEPIWLLARQTMHAGLALHANKFAACLQICDAILDSHPSHSDALILRARACFVLKEFAKAKDCFAQAQVEDTYDLFAWGRCCLNQHDYPTALRIFSTLEQRGGDAKSLAQPCLALIYLRLNEDKKAFSHLRHEDFVQLPDLAHDITMRLAEISSATQLSKKMRAEYTEHALAAAIFLAEHDPNYLIYLEHRDVRNQFLPLKSMVQTLQAKMQGSSHLHLFTLITTILKEVATQSNNPAADGAWIKEQVLLLMQNATEPLEFTETCTWRPMRAALAVNVLGLLETECPEMGITQQSIVQSFEKALLQIAELVLIYPDPQPALQSRTLIVLARLLFKLSTVAATRLAIKCLAAVPGNLPIDSETISQQVEIFTMTLQTLQKTLRDICELRTNRTALIRSSLWMLIELRQRINCVLQLIDQANQTSLRDFPRDVMQALPKDEQRQVIQSRVGLERLRKEFIAKEQQTRLFLMAMTTPECGDSASGPDSLLKWTPTHIAFLSDAALRSLMVPDADTEALLKALLNCWREDIGQIPLATRSALSVEIGPVMLGVIDIYWPTEHPLADYARSHFPDVTRDDAARLYAQLLPVVILASPETIARYLRFTVRRGLGDRQFNSRIEWSPALTHQLKTILDSVFESNEEAEHLAAALRATCNDPYLTAALVRVLPRTAARK